MRGFYFRVTQRGHLLAPCAFLGPCTLRYESHGRRAMGVEADAKG
jgi:hypothetical protein